MKVIQKENVALAGLIGTTLLAGGLLTIPGVVAGTDAVDEITITVPSSCSLSSTGGDSHTAEILNGQTNSSIGESTIKAYCNDNNGFSIYAIGYTDNELGKTVLTSSTLGSTHDILTGTNTTGNSSWAMKLSTITSPTPNYPIIIAGSTDDAEKEQEDPDYTSFQEVPDDYTLVAKRKSNTDTGENAEGATLKTTYQVHISNTQSASTYTGQVKYTMVHPYNGEAPHKPVSFDSAYATAGKQKLNGYYKMQDLTTTICSAIDEESVGEVIDVRDNQVYKIAKLKDGKCWMVENLNIAGGTALDADNTDVTSAYISSFSTSNNLTKTGDTLVLPASSSSGFDSPNYSYVYNSGNKTNCGASGQNTPCYSYYSWDAATLGSGRTIDTENTDAPYSICPKGWRLPTSRTTSATNWQTESDFYSLAHQYGLDSTTQTYEFDDGFYTQAGPGTAPNFLLAGYDNSGSFLNGGSDGIYWSSTSYSNTTSARYLYFDSSSVNSASNFSRRRGFSVRCIFGGGQ